MTHGVEIGAVLTREYYQVPEWTGFGDSFDTYAGAVQHARLRKDTLWEQGIDRPRVHIDTRWIMQNPTSAGTVDVLVHRAEFATDETRLQWDRAQVGDRVVLAVSLDLHDQAAATAWTDYMLSPIDGPALTAARVDEDGKNYPVEVVHREGGWRLVTRDNPEAFDRVCKAIADNPPGVPGGNPFSAASVAVQWIGSDRRIWLHHTPDED